VYYHTPSHFLPNLESDNVLSKLKEMDLILVIGNEDPFLENNQQLSTTLAHKGIRHQLILWNERAHSGYYWRRMAPLYI
jgi:esterase/lipase superfamily enzyme